MSKASIVRGKAAAAAAVEDTAPKGRGKKSAAAAAPAEDTAPKGRGKKSEAAENGAPRGSRGADRRYKLLVKDNPFREGSKRHDFWDIMTSCKTTGEVRQQEPLCTTAFFDSCAERELLEYLD